MAISPDVCAGSPAFLHAANILPLAPVRTVTENQIEPSAFRRLNLNHTPEIGHRFTLWDVFHGEAQ
jgi:hypothetical protein